MVLHHIASRSSSPDTRAPVRFADLRSVSTKTVVSKSALSKRACLGWVKVMGVLSF